jgi:predicted membrane-bound dolichyl-phosphate-mannose-protein mannosyltransferase
MTDTQARARVWTLCLAALVRAALTGPLAALLAPLAHASSPTLNVVAAVLSAALVGAYVALAVLLIVAVLRVVRPRPDGCP